MSQLSIHDKAVLNCIFNPSLPLSEGYEEANDIELQDEEDESARKTAPMEITAIQYAEAGDFEKAVNTLNEAISLTPERASLYNNRAQVNLLRSHFEEALEDLSKAIQLDQNKRSRALSAALCQRGLLHRKNGNVDLAKEDFEKAAKLGSSFAKSQLIELNPYSALCNQMLRKVIEDLK